MNSLGQFAGWYEHNNVPSGSTGVRGQIFFEWMKDINFSKRTHLHGVGQLVHEVHYSSWFDVAGFTSKSVKIITSNNECKDDGFKHSAHVKPACFVSRMYYPCLYQCKNPCTAFLPVLA